MARTRRARRSLVLGRDRRRGGYTLVFFAMMLFGIMAMAALVIDIGMARVAQRQMQSAAEAAALEGLRGEGTLDYDDRRAAARKFIHWHFDDDLDSSGTYPADDDGAFDSGSGQFGAGPLVQFSGGAGDPSLVASQFMEVDPGNPVYKPEVQDGTASPTSGSFRVELRRGVTETANADLFADGPAVPYLFARGSLVNRQLIAAGISVRATGIASGGRAMAAGAAIPDAVYPALDPPFDGVPGFTPFALDWTYWNDLRVGAGSGKLTIDEEGALWSPSGTVGKMIAIASLSAAIDDSATSLTVVSDEGFPPVDGFTVRLDNELLRVIDGAGTTTWTVERGADLSTAVGHAADTPLVLQQTIGLGQAVLADSTSRLGSRLPTDLTLLTGKDFHTWVPLTTPITSEPGVTRIVGFGWVTTWTVDSINAMTVNTQPGGIAWQNASAVPAVTWPDLSVDAFQELFDAHAGVDEPLLAPVLVR